MEPSHHLTFGPFCLDVTHGRLWRGEQPLALRPRLLAVLHYLVEHPGGLVTKAELRRQVWAGTHVTDVKLRVSIREIRAALGDSATPVSRLGAARMRRELGYALAVLAADTPLVLVLEDLRR